MISPKYNLMKRDMKDEAPTEGLPGPPKTKKVSITQFLGIE